MSVLAFVWLLVRLATSVYFADVDEITATAVQTRIKPQGVVTMGDAVPAGQCTGEAVFNKMLPARGVSPDLTDGGLQRAIAYMVNTAGGHFTAPEPSADAAVTDVAASAASAAK